MGRDIVSKDFIAITRYFFPSYAIPRCINATRIVLVSKIENLVTINDFKPISCCNMMYKCIFKVIMSRLKRIFPNFICPAHTTFVPGRRISGVILLTRELIRITIIYMILCLDVL